MNSNGIAMNNDVLSEILLHLPVQSLLRFRAVCKFWCEVIDSPSFRKLHNSSNKSDDDTVCLRVSFRHRVKTRLSIVVRHKKNPLVSYESDHFDDFCLSNCVRAWGASLVGPVKGLICINYSRKLEKRLVICNPFLGQVKILPLATSSSSSSSSCGVGLVRRQVAIGFDEDSYKVVQLLSCDKHRRLHAHLYSTRTNSWRELDGSGLDHLELCGGRSIESRCKNGYFAHWLVRQHLGGGGGGWESVILSFDIKNEVFRKITLLDRHVHPYHDQIFAQDEHSFVRVVIDDLDSDNIKVVELQESRCEEGKLSWKSLMAAEVPLSKVPLGGPGCVFFKDGRGAFIVYDYRARKLVGRRRMRPLMAEIVQCRGSFVSLEH